MLLVDRVERFTSRPSAGDPVAVLLAGRINRDSDVLAPQPQAPRRECSDVIRFTIALGPCPK